jgi:hypothetical protein
MATETQNPQEPPATGDTEPGSEEAALQALSQLGGEAEEPEPKESPATEEGADAEEAEPDESEETGEPEGLIRVEYEGEEFEVPPKIKDALLRQADYSRKMNEVGGTEKRAKATLERAELITASVDRVAEAQGQAAVLDAQVQRFEGIDWAGIRQQNPAEYAALQADLLSLSNQRDKALSAVQSLKENLSHERQQQISAARVEMDKVLSKDLKGWGDELGAKISTYALSQGYTTEDLSRVTDPRVVIALDKARRFDELQNAKLELKASVRGVPKVVKPGSPRQSTNVAELAKARFQKTRSDDDAIALLEARSKR